MRKSVALILVPLLLSACAVSNEALLAEGRAAAQRGDHAAAAKAFGGVLENEKITQFERLEAEIGLAVAFLRRKDYVGAETRLRRLSDQVSAKWYHLAEIAEARGEREKAIELYRKALSRQHGGDTGLRLAHLIGGEARTFKELAEAAEVLEASGHADKAAAVGAASAAWRGLLAGKEPLTIREALATHTAALEDYPAAQVVRGRVFDRLGKREQASACWDLSSMQPPPTPDYVTWARELRARLALERADDKVLGEVLERSDPETAARIRNRLAESRLWRGDADGADALWRDTVDVGGEPAPLASAYLARQLQGLGRTEEAEKAWKVAWESKGQDPRLLALLAQRQAERGDLLGACALLADVEPAALGDEEAAARALLRAGELLRLALDAFAEGDEEGARGLAASVRSRVPLEPVSLELIGEKLAEAPKAAGHSLLALERVKLVRALRRGALEDATALVKWWKGLPAHEGRAPPPRETFGESLEAELHAGLRRGLQLGRKKQVKPLLDVAALAPDSKTMTLLRSCSSLESVDLPGPRGLLALPQGTTWGVLTVPKTSRRFPRAGVTREGTSWTLHLPRTTVALKDRAAFEALLGVDLEQVRWTVSLDGEDFEEQVDAALGSRRAPAARVQVP